MSDTTDKKDQVRVHVIFDADEVLAIDNYSFKARIRTRSEAIRSLIKKGLMSEYLSDAEEFAQQLFREQVSNPPKLSDIERKVADHFSRPPYVEWPTSFSDEDKVAAKGRSQRLVHNPATDEIPRKSSEKAAKPVAEKSPKDGVKG